MRKLVSAKGLESANQNGAAHRGWERLDLASFDVAPKASPACVRNIAMQAPIEIVAALSVGHETIAATHEAARHEGYQTGFDTGREEGLRAGRELATTAAQEAATQLAQAISNFETGVAALEVAVADELLALAVEIARKVTQQAIATQPQIILGVIHAALAQLPLHAAMIRLNPQDSALVRECAGEPLARAGHRILEDPQLARGDVVVEADGTHLDARLATRWQRVIGALNQDAPWLATDAEDVI